MMAQPCGVCPPLVLACTSQGIPLPRFEHAHYVKPIRGCCPLKKEAPATAALVAHDLFSLADLNIS